MLQHEKTYTLDDGSKLRIILSLESPATGIAQVAGASAANYRVWAETKPKGGRTWQPVINTDAFDYRKMSREERDVLRLKSCLNLAGKERVQSLANEFWQLLQPNIDVNFK